MITVLTMFSKILIKLIDQAIVPAILLLTVRVVSVVWISHYLGAELTIQQTGLTFTDPHAYKIVNSYSILAMVIMLVLGLSYVLLKSYAFHDSHIKPGTTAKVFSYKMSHIIQNSYELYTQGAIWLSYTYLLTIVAGIMGTFGLTYKSVFTVSFILSVVATVLFILDIEHEVKVAELTEPNLDIDWAEYLEEEGFENE
jgi:hypothetical protein